MGGGGPSSIHLAILSALRSPAGWMGGIRTHGKNIGGEPAVT